VAVDIIKAQIEMLGQEAVENPNADTELDTAATATETGTDGNLAAGVSDDAVGRGLMQQRQTSLRRGLLLLIPESNGNKGHQFDPPEQGLLLPATTGAGPFISSTTPPSSATSNMSSISADSSQMSSSLDLRPIAPELLRFNHDNSPPIGLSPLDPVPGTRGSLSPLSNGSIAKSPNTLSSSFMMKSPLLDGNNRHQNHRAGPKIDLILMDCAMPVKSGFDAASEIRAMGTNSTFAASIPIIALTASAVTSTREKCIAAGMNGYLSKPTKLADLEAMLEQWIE
jgi:CheY-like chemotaxis protein